MALRNAHTTARVSTDNPIPVDRTQTWHWRPAGQSVSAVTDTVAAWQTEVDCV